MGQIQYSEKYFDDTFEYSDSSSSSVITNYTFLLLLPPERNRQRGDRADTISIDMLNSMALLFFTILFLSISDAISIPSPNNEIDPMLVRNSLIGENEDLMPSEISRRVLIAHKRYIGYETLRRDMVPCQKPGASYYDCRSGQANSYNRGCDTITRCARDTSEVNT